MLHLAGQDSRGLARALGIELADARRILGAVVGRGRPLREARNVRREVLDVVEARCAADRLERLDAIDASDGFRKYLFRLPDGARVEAVRIPLYDTHHTLCLSSQVGCALGCSFCATGRLGLTRNLAAWEIVAQYLEVRADSTLPITGAVFMGQGEPFHNYDAVLQAAYVLCDPAGGRVDQRRISHLHRRGGPHDPPLHGGGAQVPALRLAQRGAPRQAGARSCPSSAGTRSTSSSTRCGSTRSAAGASRSSTS